MKQVILVVMTLIASSAFSYRYVCNGLLADGEERTDQCGECNQQRAARWPNPEVTVAISSKPLPSHISKTQWRDIVQDSFAVWNNIPGSAFRFILSNDEAKREFGEDTDDTHEIMWITSKEEWRTTIGVGEFGTLGATVPRYRCDYHRGRTIFDADMALNGLSHVNWQVHCEDDDFDCVQVQTTLVHELGHFLGLDHACLGCQTSVMSARAVYNIKKTMPDDEDGVRSLYLANRNGLGGACEDDIDCKDEFICNDTMDNRFCTLLCVSDEDCPTDTRCVGHQHEKYCTFREKNEKGWEEESCAKTPCENPLVCAGRSRETSHCYATCSFFGDCLNDKSCVHFNDDLTICMNVRNRGEECDESDICDTGLNCIFGQSGLGACQKPCDQNGKCENGEKCLRSAGGEHYCEGELNLGDTDSYFRGSRKSKRLKTSRSTSEGSCQGEPADMFLWVAVLIAWLRFRRK